MDTSKTRRRHILMDKGPERIGIFIPTLEGGGAEKVIADLSGEFTNRGLSVDLIVCDGSGPVRNSISSRVNVVELGVGRTIAAIPSLVRYMAEVKPTAILSALTHANLTLLIASCLVVKKPRIVISEHNSLTAILKNRDSTKYRIRRWLISRLYSRANAMIVVSRDMQDQFYRLLPGTRGKCRTIYNPLDQQSITDKAKCDIPPDVILPPEPSPFILGVGRLAPQKDFGTLLEAFAIVRKEFDVWLVILGQGPDEEALRQKAISLGIEDEVFFPGFVLNPYPIIARSTVFVLSSLWEGLPTVVLEALVLKKPVVCTDCPTGPSEILENGKWGQLCPIGQADALAEAIQKTLTSEHTVDTDEALKRFDRKSIIDDYLETLLYGQL